MNNRFTKYTKSLLLSEFDYLLQTHKLNEFFSDDEISAYGSEKGYKSLAARYLIKKILINHAQNLLNYSDISILNESNGKPRLLLKKRYTETNVHISLSHTRKRVSVLVIIDDNEL